MKMESFGSNSSGELWKKYLPIKLTRKEGELLEKMEELEDFDHQIENAWEVAVTDSQYCLLTGNREGALDHIKWLERVEHQRNIKLRNIIKQAKQLLS